MMSVAVVSGHVSDPRLRLGGAAQEVSAEAWRRASGSAASASPSRTRTDPGGMRRAPTRSMAATGFPAQRCGSPTRRSQTCSWCGRNRPPRQPDPRLRARKGHEGSFRAQDRRQAVAARLDHRRGCDGQCRGWRGCAASQRIRAEGAFRLSEPGSLRHFLGRDGCCGRLLVPRPPVRARPQAVRQAAGWHAALPEEARRHADKLRSGFRVAPGRPPHG